MATSITFKPLFLILLCGVLILLLFGLYSSHNTNYLIPSPFPKERPWSPKPENKPDHWRDFTDANSTGSHPIDSLIAEARQAQEEILKLRSYDLTLAAKRYRRRRKRHPPPGFDKWMEYAVKHDAVVVEEYFDRIYHDLQPFWAMDPKILTESAANWEDVVQVRDGRALPVATSEGVDWLGLWTKLVAEFAEHLPDVDMPINHMDESRLFVPWDEIDRLVKIAQQEQKILPAKETIQRYQKGIVRANISEMGPELHRPNWIHNLDIPIWNHVAAGCSPTSKSHNVAAITDLTTAPEFPPWDEDNGYSRDGYVKNATASTDPCQQPHMRGLHGSFIEPLSASISNELFPLFGGSKLTTNNEILIPGAMYLTDDPFYSGGASYGPPWEDKTTSVSWRGVGSGGRHKAENWRHFQRQRAIEMLNGTRLESMQMDNAEGMTFRLPSPHIYPSALGEPGKMAAWLTEHADAAFVNILCFPPDGDCSYLSEYFHTVEPKPMVEQYRAKFFVDVDGNSFSARYRALVLSTSVPIKATMYAEWHDDRLRPWLHYIPMDNTLQDMYGILDYFTRDEKGDAAAHWIAESGKAWGEASLRREDMLLYTWRVLLEFARICDVNRHQLAYVDDLAAGGRY